MVKPNPVSERLKASMDDLSVMSSPEKLKKVKNAEDQLYHNFLQNAIRYSYGEHDGRAMKEECNNLGVVAKFRQSRNNAKSLSLHAMKRLKNNDITNDEFQDINQV